MTLKSTLLLFKSIFIKILLVVAAVVFLWWLFGKLAGSTDTYADKLGKVGQGLSNISGRLTGMPEGSLGPEGAGGETASSTAAATVPPAAAGGLFVKATPVVIGEKGPEVAMSAPDFANMMSVFADKITAAIEGGAGGGGGGGQMTINTPVTLDGQVIAQSVSQVGNLDSLRRGEIT